MCVGLTCYTSSVTEATHHGFGFDNESLLETHFTNNQRGNMKPDVFFVVVVDVVNLNDV